MDVLRRMSYARRVLAETAACGSSEEVACTSSTTALSLQTASLHLQDGTQRETLLLTELSRDFHSQCNKVEPLVRAHHFAMHDPHNRHTAPPIYVTSRYLSDNESYKTYSARTTPVAFLLHSQSIPSCNHSPITQLQSIPPENTPKLHTKCQPNSKDKTPSSSPSRLSAT